MTVEEGIGVERDGDMAIHSLFQPSSHLETHWWEGRDYTSPFNADVVQCQTTMLQNLQFTMWTWCAWPRPRQGRAKWSSSGYWVLHQSRTKQVGSDTPLKELFLRALSTSPTSDILNLTTKDVVPWSDLFVLKAQLGVSPHPQLGGEWIYAHLKRLIDSFGFPNVLKDPVSSGHSLDALVASIAYPAQLFRVTGSFSHWKNPKLPQMPGNLAISCDSFESYFVDKVLSRCHNLLANVDTVWEQEAFGLSLNSVFDTFSQFSWAHVDRIIEPVMLTIWPLDLCPSGFVKASSEGALDHLVDIINLSLAMGGVYPEGLMEDVVVLLLKKQTLDPTDESN